MPIYLRSVAEMYETHGCKGEVLDSLINSRALLLIVVAAIEDHINKSIAEKKKQKRPKKVPHVKLTVIKGGRG